MNRLKPLERAFKKGFYYCWKPLLKQGRPSLGSIDARKIQSVLFIRPEKIGDMVISLPAFDGLKKQFPHIRIGFIASYRNYGMVKDDPRFHRVYLYRKNIIRDILLARKIRQEGYDCVIDMTSGDSVTTLFLSQVCTSDSPRISVQKIKYREFYDFNHVDDDFTGDHIIDHTIKLLRPLGVNIDEVDRYAAPYIKPESYEKVDTFFGAILDGSRPLKIGYNVSAGAPNRILAIEKSTDLVSQLCDEHSDGHIIVIATPGDRDRARQIREQVNRPNVHIVPSGMSLMDASALLSRLDVLITPDTSLVHIGRSFKVPVVAFFSSYPKNVNRWKPYGQEVGPVISQHIDNIYDITVEQVMHVYRQIVTRYQVTAK